MSTLPVKINTARCNGLLTCPWFHTNLSRPHPKVKFILIKIDLTSSLKTSKQIISPHCYSYIYSKKKKNVATIDELAFTLRCHIYIYFHLIMFLTVFNLCSHFLFILEIRSYFSKIQLSSQLTMITFLGAVSSIDATIFQPPN